MALQIVPFKGTTPLKPLKAPKYLQTTLKTTKDPERCTPPTHTHTDFLLMTQNLP